MFVSIDLIEYPSSSVAKAPGLWTAYPEFKFASLFSYMLNQIFENHSLSKKYAYFLLYDVIRHRGGCKVLPDFTALTSDEKENTNFLVWFKTITQLKLIIVYNSLNKTLISNEFFLRFCTAEIKKNNTL